MQFGGSEFLTVVTFLLPGFVAGWIFHGLTPYPKPAQFERVVQALIFTMVVQALLLGCRQVSYWLATKVSPIGAWTDDVAFVWSVSLACALGLTLARFANNDQLHAILRWAGFTRLTSYSSEWFAQFTKSQTYVVLHLKGERRLYGWPEHWPSTRKEGEFSIAEAEWLDGTDRIALTGVAHVLIPADEVEFVEFMEVEVEEQSDDEEADPTA